jgi:hypothetical protein
VDLVSRSLHRGLKLVAWVILGIVGFLALLVVGWVPPELAAMLGSRHQRSGGRGGTSGPTSSRSARTEKAGLVRRPALIRSPSVSRRQP